MEGKTISIKELLQITVDELNRIMVPVEFADAISRPLCQAVANIKLCITAMKDEPKEGDEKDVPS